jgi:hypothetical protein
MDTKKNQISELPPNIEQTTTPHLINACRGKVSTRYKAEPEHKIKFKSADL